MTAFDYLNTLTKRPFFSAYTLEENVEICGRTFPFKASFDLRGERPLVFGVGKTPCKQCVEFLFLDAPKSLDAAYLAELLTFITEAETELVHPHRDHLATYITVAAASEQTAEELKQLTKKCKFEKRYERGKFGFFSFRLVTVNPVTGEVFTNRAATELKTRFAV